MNTYVENLKKLNNFKLTENGAIAHASTLSKVYDLFAFGGAYRNRTDLDCVKLFGEAYNEDPTYALKCLFYLRDIRGGQGERRFFRICFRWLCMSDPKAALRNLHLVPEFGRWDDLIYSTFGTDVEIMALETIKAQLKLDIQCKTPSLLAKWLPSENASSQVTRNLANIIRQYLQLNHKEYRVLLSSLRKKIKIVESLMSQNRWDEIEFDKIPSRAGLIYKNAFARRDILAKKYENFIKDKNTKVNAKDLYPYDIVRQITRQIEEEEWGYLKEDEPVSLDIKRLAWQKAWDNLPDYFKDNPEKMIAVVDTSGSMTWGEAKNAMPIDVAISLGIYCAEKNTGDFANKYITFSNKPTLIEINKNNDIYAKVKNIFENGIISNTDLEKTFALLKEASLYSAVKDRPETLLVISDMEIDRGVTNVEDNDEFITLMERIRKDWEKSGLVMPKLVYWNVNARNNTILDLGPDVSYVSGCSPVIFEMVLTGKTGKNLMLSKLDSDRYADIK